MTLDGAIAYFVMLGAALGTALVLYFGLRAIKLF